MGQFQPDSNAITRAAEAAIQAVGPQHVAEIERITAGITCAAHGAAPTYLGPWPSIIFEDFCCDDLRRRVVAALEPISWIRLDQAA